MDNIGTATMEPDGTITLFLRADDGAGTVGHATFAYAPGNIGYDDLLAHLGGLAPGESKPVPPWD